MHIDGLSSDQMKAGFVDAPEISPCPFCGVGFQKPPNPTSPIIFHPGVMTDGKCILSGMGFREHQFELLNRRAPGDDR